MAFSDLPKNRETPFHGRFIKMNPSGNLRLAVFLNGYWGIWVGQGCLARWLQKRLQECIHHLPVQPLSALENCLHQVIHKDRRQYSHCIK